MTKQQWVDQLDTNLEYLQYKSRLCRYDAQLGI